MKLSVDSSSFAKRYVQEVGSNELDDVLQGSSELALCVILGAGTHLRPEPTIARRRSSSCGLPRGQKAVGGRCPRCNCSSTYSGGYLTFNRPPGGKYFACYGCPTCRLCSGVESGSIRHIRQKTIGCGHQIRSQFAYLGQPAA